MEPKFDSFANKNNNELSLSAVIAEIMLIEEKIMRGGNVDSEIDYINRIVDQLKRGLISPTKALKLVHELEQSRQDYH
jgi:hypothetical protein